MIATFFRRLLDVLRDAFHLCWLAPAIPLIAVIPEFIQHVVEINLGMFDSRDLARALSDDPTRWAFGYAKLAGYLITILAAVRFWAGRAHGLKWYSPKNFALKVFGLALLLNAVVMILEAVIEGPLKVAVGVNVTEAFSVGISIATLPLLVLLVAGLVGDKNATVGSVYRTGWLAALRIVLFSAVVLIPLMALHSYNHTLAIGSDTTLVWGIMIFDSLLIGLLAVGWGTAIHHGYQPLEPTR